MRKKPKEIIRSFKNHGSVDMAAKETGVHRTTVYRWLKRARSGWSKHLREGVRRKSTRPKHIHYILSPDDRIHIESLRIQRGFNALKIVKTLKLLVSHMTVHRYLKRRNLVRKSNHRRRPKFQNTIHMHVKNTPTVGYIQMDVKYVTPERSGLPWTCFEYAIIDIFSRYKDAVILNQLDQDHTVMALQEMLPRLPFRPVFVQTDNGLEFQKRFKEFCERKGLKHHHIHKSTPNENAVIERSFRTDEEEFYFRQNTRPKDYDELRKRFSEYLTFYNTERLHMGIEFKTPLEVVVADVVLY